MHSTAWTSLLLPPLSSSLQESLDPSIRSDLMSARGCRRDAIHFSQFNRVQSTANTIIIGLVAYSCFKLPAISSSFLCYVFISRPRKSSHSFASALPFSFAHLEASFKASPTPSVRSNLNIAGKSLRTGTFRSHRHNEQQYARPGDGRG